MGTTAVSTDKRIFQELQFMLGGTKHFAWYSDPTVIANQVAAGAENVGPRWSLWTENATGRIPIYRYSRQPDSTRSLRDTAFVLMNTWTMPGYTIDIGGDPVGYGTTEAAADADALPILQCTGSGDRFAFTQWQHELDQYVSQAGMTAQPTNWYAPMMCLVESTYDATSHDVVLTSNDPDPVVAAQGEVNVYRGTGTAIRFYNAGVGEFGPDAIAVTYKTGSKAGDSAIGAEEAFQLSPTSFPNSVWLTTDDTQTAVDQEFEYSVTVLVGGEPYTHDPKIIQRKIQLVD